MECRIGQINVGKGAIVMEEMVRVGRQEGLEVLLIQEPYLRDGQIRGLGGRWFFDGRQGVEVGSAIVVLEETIDAMMIVQETGGACVSVQMNRGGKSLKAVSLYCRPSEGIEGHLRKVEEICRNNRSRGLVVGGDFNARSRMWWSDRTDRRGEKVEEMVETCELEVLNKWSRWTTFQNTQGGKSNIDVTLATKDIARSLEKWEVLEETLSDHRLMKMEFKNWQQRRKGRNEMREGSWNLREVDWVMFDRVLVEEVGRLQWEGKTADECASELQEAIRTVMERTVPRSRRGQKKVHWWTDRIAEMRVRLRRCRRRWMRTRTEEDRREFVTARTAYVWEIRQEKRNAWQKLLDEGGENDPWGKAYKIVMERTKTETILTSMRKEDGSFTATVDETLEWILQGLLPDDRPEDDTEEQSSVRDQMEVASEGPEEPEFTEGELDRAVSQMKNGRAPGLDGVKAEIVKRMYGRIKECLLTLYNKMLVEGRFPSVWKEGIVKIFLKNKDRDPSEVKSYRPVTLLPVLGKIGEKLIVRRMRRWMNEESLMSEGQYGFTEGRGTVDALMKVRRDVEEAGEKYVLAVSLDIAGAFDSAWWPDIMRVLKSWNCSRNLYCLVGDYFRGREVVLRVGNAEARKNMTRGCPQGSVVGPLLWNVLFDSLLRLETGEGVTITAYADDALLLVRGQTTHQLADRGSRAVERVIEWGRRRKLTFSRTKTVTMMLKGRLVRPPRLLVEGEHIRCKKEMKYLGVVVGQKMVFEKHVEEVTEKMKGIYGKLARQASANRGMSGKHMMTLYKGCVEPAILYGCEFWGKDARKIGSKRKLLSIQRRILMKVARAYNTVSHDAIRVLTGAIPLDLLVEEKMKIWEDKEAGLDVAESKHSRRQETLDEWQRRWENSEKGRLTFEFMPDIRRRLSQEWQMDHYLTQFVTGHGRFKANLKRFNLVEEDMCGCGELETASHVLMECPLQEESRRELREVLQRKNLDWTKANFAHDQETIEVLRTVTRKIGRSRET